jgi:sugar/nucleoside kinase (ribokinase family)
MPTATAFAIDTFAAGGLWDGGLALASAQGRDAARAERFANAVAVSERSRAGRAWHTVP